MSNHTAAEPMQTPLRSPQKPTGIRLFFKLLIKQRALVFMSVPFVIWLFIFRYVPVWGWIMAFQDYKPGRSIWEQKWAGFKHFEFLFTDEPFYRVMRNTLAMGLIHLVFGFVTAITLAILLNELRSVIFKRTVQTISYLPHFISWVVASSIITTALHPEEGIINEILVWLGIIDKPIMWMGEGKYFWGIYGASVVWKDLGWNTIVYLAAITMIDPALYEAAEIDGAGRFRRIWHITLPGMKPVIVVLLIMNVGQILEFGVETQLLLKNPMNMDYAETLELFVLRWGIEQGNFSFATAAGIFKTVISLILLFIANGVAKRLGEARLF